MKNVKISESLQDYLEIIYEIIEEKEIARVKEIANRRGVKMASVTSALKRLSRDGYIIYSAHELIRLTDNGKILAEKIIRRHQILKKFLIDIMKLTPEIAENDACGIEHHISKETLERFCSFYEFYNNSSMEEKKFFHDFEKYFKDKKTGNSNE